MSKFSDVKFIKIGFLIGGIYDLLLGIGVLFFSDLMVDLFGITKPDNMIFVYISGLFLILVGYILIYAAYRNVEDFLFIGIVMWKTFCSLDSVLALSDFLILL
ncbi:MAG: hypothetical protein ACTSQ9_01020 [Candidatus Hodarchaeales archaeon]